MQGNPRQGTTKMSILVYEQNDPLVFYQGVCGKLSFHGRLDDPIDHRRDLCSCDMRTRLYSVEKVGHGPAVCIGPVYRLISHGMMIYET